MTPRHLAARALAIAGRKVFVVEVGGKRPLPGSNGFKDATCNVEQIDRWYSVADYNLAMCPEDWGLGVVDFDGVEPGPEYPATHVVKTPRGQHWYYRGSVRPSASRLAPHVDTRGVGSYVLLPPSIVNGVEYVSLDANSESPLPQFITDRIIARDLAARRDIQDGTGDIPGNLDRARIILGDLVRNGNIAIEGRGGNDRTYATVARIRDLGLSRHAAIELIDEIWNPHCEPPWERWELEDVVSHVYSYAQNSEGVWAVKASAETFAHVTPPTPKSKKRKFSFENVVEQRMHPAPTWLLPDLLPDRNVTLAYGPKGSLKSFVALDIAMAMATGLPTFGLTPQRVGPVIYVSYLGEGIDDIRHRRTAAWQKFRGIDDNTLKKFYLVEGPRVADGPECEEFFADLVEHLAGTRPALIVVDTIFQLAAGIKLVESASPVRAFGDALVRTFDCGVLLIHHPPKSDPTTAYGSQDLTANTPTILRVERDKRTVAVYVERQKGSQEPEAPFTFKMVTDDLPSAVLVPTSAREHRQVIKQKDLVDRVAVFAVLNAHRMIAPKYVATYSLADYLVPVNTAGREDQIATLVKALKRLAKTDLSGYCEGSGEELKWSLPAPMSI